jgi:arsenate reductase
MSKPVLYGIPNCDTVKKARKWLEQHDIAYEFHDFRKDGLTRKQLKHWFSTVDWAQLLNKRSTSWRGLAENEIDGLTQTSASKLMLTNPTLIKRPVLVSNKQVLVGFNPSAYKQHFS